MISVLNKSLTLKRIVTDIKIAVNLLMKNIVLIPLIIVLACILMTGCVGSIKNGNASNTTVSPANTFTPFSNMTNMSNTSNITTTSGLKGPLRVSIGGWDADLPVFVDNISAGIVKHDNPLDLMLEEGNHTVKVCTGTICLEEVATVKFAKQHIVDFEERLRSEVEFPKPTARIVGYYTSGDTISITVEFINPSSKDLAMSAEVKAGYTYIESRSNNRVGNVAQGIANANVKSGARATQTMNLGLASGYSYVYSIPVISGITTR